MLSCVRRIRIDYRHPSSVMEMCRAGTVAILQLDGVASIDGGQRREPIRSAMINSTRTSFPESIKNGRAAGPPGVQLDNFIDEHYPDLPNFYLVQLSVCNSNSEAMDANPSCSHSGHV